jgi:hypothetical protein
VPTEREIVCIDGLSLRANDFIDVGAPIHNGRVLPVVVKTLVFPEVRQVSADTDADGTESRESSYVEVGGQIL